MFKCPHRGEKPMREARIIHSNPDATNGEAKPHELYGMKLHRGQKIDTNLGLIKIHYCYLVFTDSEFWSCDFLTGIRTGQIGRVEIQTD